VDQEKPTPKMPASQPEGELAQNPAVDEFLSRLHYDMHHPKPGQEAIAAALQAIQRFALEMDAEESGTGADIKANACSICGALNRAGNRFCSSCGVPMQLGQEEDATTKPAPQPNPTTSFPAGEHHYHHHYHHHYFLDGAARFGAPESHGGAAPAREMARTRAPLTGASVSRAEAAVRKMSQDWAFACNTKHLDDLVELYMADALVLRPNVPPVRGTAAIREFFFAVLDSGLGEVELEPLRVEIFGEIAYEAGRCKSLVPMAMGKRREERGKYLVVSTRHNGEWKIVADSWSSDLSLIENVISPAAKAQRKG